MVDCYITYPTVDCCMHTTYSHTPHSITVNFYCTLHVCNYPRWLLFVVYILQSHLPVNFAPSSPPLLCMCCGPCCSVLPLLLDSRI